MFSLLMYIFVFVGIAILFAVIAVVVFISKGLKTNNSQKDDPNIIDVKAIDEDQTDEAEANQILPKN